MSLKLSNSNLVVDPGSVLCDLDHLCYVTNEIKATVTVFGAIISAGLECTLRIHAANVEATVTKVIAKYKNNQLVNALFLKKGEKGQVIVKTKHLVAVEKYENDRIMGHFILSDETQ